MLHKTSLETNVCFKNNAKGTTDPLYNLNIQWINFEKSM